MKKKEKKYEVIQNIVNGNITRKETMIELDLTRQQIYRLIIRLLAKLKMSFFYFKIWYFIIDLSVNYKFALSKL